MKKAVIHYHFLYGKEGHIKPKAKLSFKQVNITCPECLKIINEMKKPFNPLDHEQTK
jgi:hypothetical protein